MQIHIQARSITLTKALKKHIEKKLKHSLQIDDNTLPRVVIRLSETDSADKLCRLHIVMSGMSDVIIEDTEQDIYQAIDQAIERAYSVVSRKLHYNKHRQKQKTGSHFELVA